MRTLGYLFLLLLFSAPLAAQRIDVVELPPATLDELARVAVAAPAGEHAERPRPALAAPRETAGAVVAAELVAIRASGAPPPITRGFRASFDPLPSATTAYYPADASGAAGPRHVVGAFNNSLSVHDRNGNQLSLLSIYQFWHDPAIPDTFLYDPRVAYDAANDRWVLAMLTDTNLRQGVLLFAVSATGDPTGTWRRFRYAAAGDPRLSLDFTRMALTADQIVITANEYDGNNITGLDLFTIAKSAAFGGGTPAPAKTHALGFDATPIASADTIVRVLFLGDGKLNENRLSDGALTFFATYTSPVPFGFAQRVCAQAGSSGQVDCGVTSLHYALLRNGVLWAVQSANDAQRARILVWKIGGGAATTYLLSDPNVDYAYPSIAVNRNGAALVGFSTLSGSIYPSAAYLLIDPAGNVSAAATVKDGERPYGYFRWGDFSTTLVDPVDDLSFWTLQSYATPPPTTLPFISWGTWWSYVQVKPPPRTRAVRH